MITSIVIIGAGLAGLTAARMLRSEGYEGRIHMIGDEPTRAYDRPSLSKSVLSGKDTLPPPLIDPSWYETAQIELRLGEPISVIDVKGGTVRSKSRDTLIAYDRLLIATGSRARYIPIDGSTLGGVFYLRGFAESLALREVMHPGMSLVIVGGGLIGCEVATTARAAGLDVTVLEASDELLLRVLGRKTGAWCRSQLENLGIKVKLNTQVSAFEGDGAVDSVIFADGCRLLCDLVLVSIGAEPADELAREAGLSCDQGVIVDSSGKTSCKNIYAAGDVALWPSTTGSRRSFETYINSQKQAEVAAISMLGSSSLSLQISSSWTEIAGHRIQMLGDIEGPGQLVVRGDWESSNPLLLFRIFEDRIESIIAINASKEFSLVSRMLTSRIFVSVADLRDISTNLRVLLKKVQ